MDKLDQPYRAPLTLGTAGLLDEESTVFYHQLFNTIQIGMVTDLIVARLRGSGVPEIGLRVSATLGFYQAFNDSLHAQGLVEEAAGKLHDPIKVEFGVDSKRVAVSARFKSESVIANINDDIMAKIISEVMIGKDSLSVFLQSATLFSDQLIVKRHAPSSQVEITCVFSVDASQTLAPRAVFLELPEELEDPPKVKELAELGDLDYVALLSPSQDQKISGGDKEDDGLTRVKGGPDESDDSSRVVKGWEEKEKSWGTGSGQGKEGEGSQSNAVLQQMVNELNMKLEAAKKELAQIKKEKGMGKGGGMFSFMKKAFSGADEEETLTVSGKVQLREIESIVQEEHNGRRAEKPPAYPNDPIELLDEVVKSIQVKSFYDVTKSNFDLAENLSEKIDSAGIRPWFNGFFRDLMRARFEMIDLVTTLQKRIKNGGAMSKSGDKALKDEIKKKDEIIRHKTTAITNFKEQIATMNVNVERFKAQAQSALADAAFKSKYQQSIKQLSGAKDEASRLRTKIDELTKTNATIRAAGASANANEISNLKIQVDKIKQQMESVKKQNKDLSSRATKAETELKPMERQFKEIKTKLGNTTKNFEEKKKEADTLKAKIVGMERELETLKKENLKLKSTSKAA